VVIDRDDFFGALQRLIWHEDEPIVWPSSISLYFVSMKAAEQVKVVLTGEGADELFGGYERYGHHLLNARIAGAYTQVPAGVRKTIRERLDRSTLLNASVRRKLQHTVLGRDPELQSLYIDNFYSAFSAEEQAALLQKPIDKRSPYASVLDEWNRAGEDRTLLGKLLYTDQKTYLVELLMKQDQMSMAASIESRVPFLDHRLVEFAATMPVEWKLRGWTTKRVLREAARDLLPRSILERPKMGFPVPFGQWARGPWQGVLRDVLLDRRARERGLFDGAAVARLLADHASGRADGADALWSLLNLELWYRTWIDGEGVQQLPSPALAARAGAPHDPLPARELAGTS
jgi:asparagine synthase (glutamine-hydrolysing)